MRDERILLAYGTGGKQSRLFIEELVLKYFNDPALKNLPDSASIKVSSDRIFFTTDSFVVNPIFFPGGNIGKLAVCGTINDLAVAGAKPVYLSCSFIIEEGFRLSDLERILKSMAFEAKKAGVRIVTGDTKVVEKGKADGIFITTSGIGIEQTNVPAGIEKIEPGDRILLSGVPGMHELAVICARGNLKFKAALKSDCASINRIISDILMTSKNVKFMRDPTRGGLAAILNEIAIGCNLGLLVYEKKIPQTEATRSLCEILGFDILNLACEGRVVAIVAPQDADKVVSVMRRHPSGRKAAVIGQVTSEFRGKVVMETINGSQRFVLMPSGRQLPRIC
ncbi:MAG: hydrogenase expression/formation protein HypE [Candidatus Omnitrophica bacterium]|nr:hydrogenase expression/formation protein HypE [Candidatus Omnitrophota bacterium]MCM8824841.1 hydrogenase expression/formation protein HypE [Candidatus Omnitrophota bacterium]